MSRVLILGGGIGGLAVARALRFAPVDVTLVDREPRHLTARDLYAAALGRKAGARREVLLGGQKNVQFVTGQAVYVDSARNRLLLEDRALPYDSLVVATGAQAHYGRPGWARSAPALRSPADARQIAETLKGSDGTVVVVGGGPAGVELAAHVARKWPARRVVLVDEGTMLLAHFPEGLQREAERRLKKLGVEVRYQLHVIAVTASGVRVSGPNGRETVVGSAVLWAGGVEGSAFGQALVQETRAETDEIGRIRVRPDLTVSGHPEIYVIGDLAHVEISGIPLPQLATIASQQGRYVASAIRDRLAGYEPAPFSHVDQGQFALIGRGGVGFLGDTQMTGASAYLAAKFALGWPRLRAYASVTGSST